MSRPDNMSLLHLQTENPMPTAWRPRILVLPVSAAIISALVAFKLLQPPQSQSNLAMDEWRSADSLKFTALDSHNQLLKFERYLSRHQIVLIFFDGHAGADHNAVLLEARQHFDKLKQRRIQVVGVSAALPQHNREAMARGGTFPFPLLSDPEFRIHEMWGRLDSETQQPLTGVFLIDRAGRVAWSGKAPKPQEATAEFWKSLMEGR